MSADRLVAEIGAVQHGIVDRAQAMKCGLSDTGIRRRLASGRLLQVHPGVYRLAGAPLTWHQRLIAACRAAGGGAVASHRAAAQLWGLLDALRRFDRSEITVERPRGPVPIGVVLHRSTDLLSRHTTLRQGIPVTNPLRTMVDLGAVLPAGEVEDALDRGLASKLFSVAAVEWMLTELSRPGRNGCGVIRRVLDERALGEERPDGLLEARMARLLRTHSLPSAAFQHPVGRYRVDFAYPEKRIAIEVDGYKVHGAPEAMEADFERQNLVVLEGWTVLRFSWKQAVRRPRDVAEAVGCVLGASTAGNRR